MTQKKGRRRPVLTVSDKQTLVYEALVENRKFKDIAKRHQISLGTVSVLVAKAKNKPNFMSDLFDKRDLKEKKVEQVKAVVENMVDRNEFIDSCESVTKKVNENFPYTLQ